VRPVYCRTALFGAENSDVLPFWRVAVAVTASPTGTLFESLSVSKKEPTPSALVVTDFFVRNVLPPFSPGGFA
jgi:hypothetical protein